METPKPPGAELEAIVRDGSPQILFALANDPNLAVPCLFDTERAVGVWYLDAGCLVFSGDNIRQVQALCLHHEDRMSPQGDRELVVDLATNPLMQTSTPATLPWGFSADELRMWLTERGLDSKEPSGDR